MGLGLSPNKISRYIGFFFSGKLHVSLLQVSGLKFQETRILLTYFLLGSQQSFTPHSLKVSSLRTGLSDSSYEGPGALFILPDVPSFRNLLCVPPAFLLQSAAQILTASVVQGFLDSVSMPSGLFGRRKRVDAARTRSTTSSSVFRLMCRPSVRVQS